MLRSLRFSVGKMMRAIIVVTELALFVVLVMVMVVEVHDLITFLFYVLCEVLSGRTVPEYAVSQVIADVLLVLVVLEIARTLLASMISEREIQLSAIVEAVFIASARKLIGMAMVTAAYSEVLADLAVAAVFFVLWVACKKLEKEGY